MANIAASSNVGALFVGSSLSEIRSHIAGAGGIALGQAFYVDPTTGTALPTDASASGKYQVRGIALMTVGAGQAFDALERGYVGGLDVSGLAFDALVYVSDTAGKLATAAGTNSSVAGRVAALTDRDSVTGKPSKVLYFRASSI